MCSGHATGEAVFARCLSSLKTERVAASKSLPGPKDSHFSGDKTEYIEHIRKVQATHPHNTLSTLGRYRPHTLIIH